jgi:hypothetical protein
MISLFLLIYIGLEISAPWWYFALVSVTCLIKILNAGIKLGKEVK